MVAPNMRSVDAREVAAYADAVLRLQDTASLAEPFSARSAGFSLDDAYAVARELLRRRESAGWRRIGRKIGFTNRTIYDQYGVYAPIFGYMYDRTVAEAEPGEAGPGGVISLAGLAQPLIEPEIALRLRRRPPATRDPVELLACVDWLAHGFEVVQCHFPDWRFAAADTVADGGLHGRYLLGPPWPLDGEDLEAIADKLASFQVMLSRDGEQMAQGGGSLVLDSPVNALAYLIEVLEGLPDHPPLEPGEVITTGTLTVALPVASGETWSTRLEGLPLPGLTLRFV